MKLSASTTSRLRSAEAPTTLTTSMLDSALSLAEQGWNVFPLRPGSKVPLLPRAHPKGEKCKGECGRDGHGAYDGTTDVAKIRRWWSENPQAGVGANLGEDRVAFDIDINHGAPNLASFPDTRRHLSGRGNGNHHKIYRVEPGTAGGAIRPAVGSMSFVAGIDIRAGRGSYIVMPPSLHEETRRPYTADAVPEHTLTDDEVAAIWAEAGVEQSATSRAAARGLSIVGGASRSGPGGTGKPGHLSSLLADPPAEGGRNEWLARVAGHYAKIYRDKRDLYDAHVYQANQLLSPPLPDEEYSKTLESIWDTEVVSHPERGASLENGWLVGNKRTLFCQIVVQEGEDKRTDLAPWGDFDIEALGVAVDEVDNRMYWVRIYWRDRVMDTTLDASVLGDDRAIRKWLASRGPTFDPPFQAAPKTPPGVRLSRYLESQRPPQVSIVETLGWHEDLKKFVTHDGGITPDGPITKEEAEVVADPKLVERDLAPYTYGFAKDWDEAQRVLNEVLSFQDTTITSIFGAWWAACLLKPQIQERTSLFPFFGVEATSESGKTNGFFDLMVAMNGNTRGQIVPTRPVLRDYASANKNGIVWADDLDDLSAYGELLRASTSNGTASKMDIDRSGIKNTQVVAPILITGEALGMNSQKALADRSVVVNVPSPKGRKSVHGNYPQWDDVLDLQAKYPRHNGGLSQLAGHYVQAALGYRDEVMSALKMAKRQGSGRHADKLAVLRAGACLLDALCGHDGAWEGQGEHYGRVQAWAEEDGAQSLAADNALTLKILPWACQIFTGDKPVEHTMGRWQGIDAPVFVRKTKRRTDGGEGLSSPDEPTHEVWFSVPLLSLAWARDHANRIEVRTESKDALTQQATALGVDRGKAVMVSGTGRRGWYRQLPPEYARVVLERAGG